MLGLRIRHVKLMSLHEFLFIQADVLHGFCKEISAGLLLLINHFHNELLVLVRLVVAEEVTALYQELLLFLSVA